MAHREGTRLSVVGRALCARPNTGLIVSEAPPQIAVQVYNRAVHNQMLEPIRDGRSIKQVLACAKDELAASRTDQFLAKLT